MTFQDLRFLNFSAIYWMLALLPLWAIFWALFDYRQRTLEKFATAATLPEIIYPRSSWRFWGKLVLLSLAWISAVIALMEPVSYGQYKKGAEEKREPPIAHDLVFLLDASASMEVPDSPESSSRFVYAKSIVGAILNRLHGEQAALYAFTSEVEQISPLTHDYLFVREMMRQTQINEGGYAGTHLLDAMRAVYEKQLVPSKAQVKTLIVLTDGEDTQLEAEPSSKQESLIKEKSAWLQKAEKEHLRVFTVGLGTPEGKEVPGIRFEGHPVVSALNSALLRQISQQGRGKYYEADSYAMLDLASAMVLAIEQDYEGIAVQPGVAGGTELVYKTYYQFPLLLAILCIALTLWLLDVNVNAQRVRGSAAAAALLLALLHSVQLSGAPQTLNAKAHMAQGLLESGQPARARAEYQEMLQEPLNPWERAVIMYDLGYSWLQEGEWQNALLTFQAVPTDNLLGPVLAYRSSYNSLLAKYGAAHAVEEQDPDQALALLQGLLPQLDKVKASFCELASKEGSPFCPPAKRVEALAQLFQREMFNVVQRKEDRLAHLNQGLDKAGALLQGHINHLLKSYPLIESLGKEKRLQKEYEALFAREKERWSLLAGEMDVKIQGEHEAELRLLLEKAQQQFTEGMDSLQKGQFDQSQSALKEAQTLLARFLKLLPPSKKPPPPQEGQAKKSPEEAAPSPVVNNVLRSLLQMEEEDQQPLSQQSLKTPLKTIDPRPW